MLCCLCRCAGAKIDARLSAVFLRVVEPAFPEIDDFHITRNAEIFGRCGSYFVEHVDARALGQGQKRGHNAVDSIVERVGIKAVIWELGCKRLKGKITSREKIGLHDI